MVRKQYKLEKFTERCSCIFLLFPFLPNLYKYKVFYYQTHKFALGVWDSETTRNLRAMHGYLLILEFPVWHHIFKIANFSLLNIILVEAKNIRNFTIQNTGANQKIWFFSKQSIGNTGTKKQKKMNRYSYILIRQKTFYWKLVLQKMVKI